MNKFIIIGLIIAAVYFLINRFLVKIPSKIAILILILLVGVACFIVGFVQMKQQGII